jgi:hypothetical protein
LGSALRARKYQTQCRETVLRAITYNVMIVRIEVFYRAKPTPILEVCLAHNWSKILIPPHPPGDVEREFLIQICHIPGHAVQT